MAGELVEFEEGAISIALNLESYNVGVLLIDVLYLSLFKLGLLLLIRCSLYGVVSENSLLGTGTLVKQQLLSFYAAHIVTTFQERVVIEYTIVAAETANSLATLHYLTPYAGATLAEHFIPSSCEGYPADVFYLHLRLLESAAKSSSRLDGQIFLSANLFNAEIRLAINVGYPFEKMESSFKDFVGTLYERKLKAKNGKDEAKAYKNGIGVPKDREIFEEMVNLSGTRRSLQGGYSKRNNTTFSVAPTPESLRLETSKVLQSQIF
ncbi:hypothetical protein Cgig2_003028 [Carnegiea gigantea]|uniref:Uncharacterized protein n=1 Tax=Carnegiea gigantea TaxID=171969 RepID=A0A9Q1JJ05_9CARY|nr:hypothetical protein Cgig2_003028 [Carnegiea gigantea]